ncbi:histidine phosphotransferase family protein [Altererythrobacter sp. H2]|uniref:histidine phosphotransferase family protein n=1 Tax=Altererythrobacter sp. H2 TaxID=3108391 RepID=UPI000BD1590C|nr:histidine phosphotransferase family protein [Altererythrobacter sp. H2]OZA93631.1 MAG: histidine phosphotransferase [Erythrobacter sp. 34-65-8]WRK95547.1 histidine phosphotransferase family protein [Altererythrobacter sp. H2]
MNNQDAIDLASLLCSRLCHDMLSPVGALSNGLELLASENDPEMRQRCFELLEQSARISTDKLKFFRLAFGAAGGFGEMVEVAEPRALIQALVGDAKRITINWALDEAKLPKPAVKILLNLAQIGLDTLVRGGTLDVGVERRDSDYEIVVRATGPKIAFDPVVGQALQGELSPAELTSRTAPAHLMGLLAEQTGGGLQYHLTDEALVLGAVLPQPEGLIG